MQCLGYVPGNREHWEEGELRSRRGGSWERAGVPLGLWGPQSSGLW